MPMPLDDEPRWRRWARLAASIAALLAAANLPGRAQTASLVVDIATGTDLSAPGSNPARFFTATGAVRTYQNPSGQFASVADTAAF